MKKEILRITMDIEDLPKDAQIMDFQITIREKGWFTRIFHNWEKISVKRLLIKNLEVIKKSSLSPREDK